MDIITAAQKRRIYALAAGLGILESGNKNDMLHELVCSITGKTSVSDLTVTEFNKVQHELIERMRYSNHTAPLKKKEKPQRENVADMMTNEQISLAWRYMYRLQELDEHPKFHQDRTPVTVGERMEGALVKILNITPNMKEPFRWVNITQGTAFIETLKRYVRSAEKKAKAKAGVG